MKIAYNYKYRDKKDKMNECIDENEKVIKHPRIFANTHIYESLTSKRSRRVRVTGPLWGETTVRRWIRSQRSMIRSISMFSLLLASTKAVKQTADVQVVWDTKQLMKATSLVMARIWEIYMEQIEADWVYHQNICLLRYVFKSHCLMRPRDAYMRQ